MVNGSRTQWIEFRFARRKGLKRVCAIRTGSGPKSDVGTASREAAQEAER